VDACTPTATGSIGDFIWNDLDGDGVQDGGSEVGFEGVIVHLWLDTNSDGTGDTLLATTTTDATGFYEFAGLANNAGGEQYLVVVDTTSVPGSGSQTGDPDEAGTCLTCDSQYGVTIAGASDVTNADFGYQQGTVVFGLVYSDMDADGTRDTGEPGIAGVTVDLIRTSDSFVYGADTTDANGNYSFDLDGVAVTDYRVVVTGPPASATQTADPDESGTCSVCDGDKDQFTATVDGTHGSYDFGYHVAGTFTIGDSVYLDWDGNGTQAAAEAGIEAVTLRLYQDNGPVAGS